MPGITRTFHVKHSSPAVSCPSTPSIPTRGLTKRGHHAWAWPRPSDERVHYITLRDPAHVAESSTPDHSPSFQCRTERSARGDEVPCSELATGVPRETLVFRTRFVGRDGADPGMAGAGERVDQRDDARPMIAAHRFSSRIPARVADTARAAAECGRRVTPPPALGGDTVGRVGATTAVSRETCSRAPRYCSVATPSALCHAKEAGRVAWV